MRRTLALSLAFALGFFAGCAGATFHHPKPPVCIEPVEDTSSHAVGMGLSR